MDNMRGFRIPAKSIPQRHSWPPLDWLDANQGKDAWAAEIIEQYSALGLSHADAERVFQAVYADLAAVLEAIDPHALAAAPIPERASMLLPRFDFTRLATTLGIDTALAQSAAAILVLEFVMHAYPLF